MKVALPGLELDEADVQREVDRRRPAAGAGSTSRAEEDRVEIISGFSTEGPRVYHRLSCLEPGYGLFRL